MSQRTEGHNHVLDKIQTDEKFRTENKTLNLASFMNLHLRPVLNKEVRADWLVAALIISIFCAYRRLKATVK